MVASDNLFVVTTPDYPTLATSLRAAILAKQRGRPISGLILNKIRDPDYELSLDEIEEATGIPVVAKIPDDAVSVKSIFTRIPIPVYDKKSKFAKEVNRLSYALTNREEKKSFWRTLFPLSLRREEVNRQILRDDFYNSIFEDE